MEGKKIRTTDDKEDKHTRWNERGDKIGKLKDTQILSNTLSIQKIFQRLILHIN